VRNARRVTLGNVILAETDDEKTEWRGIPALAGKHIVAEFVEGNTVDIEVYEYRYLDLEVCPDFRGFTPEQNEALWDELDELSGANPYPIYGVRCTHFTATGNVVVEWSRDREARSLHRELRQAEPMMTRLREVCADHPAYFPLGT